MCRRWLQPPIFRFIRLLLSKHSHREYSTRIEMNVYVFILCLVAA